MVQERSSSLAAAAKGAKDGAEPKGTINIRIEAQTRQLIDDAAAALGKTRTEFLIESVRNRAIDVLLDQKLFSLDDDRFRAFADALDQAPAPGSKLRQLLRRKPAWASLTGAVRGSFGT